MGRCEITGSCLADSELMLCHGKRVGPQGRRVLLALLDADLMTSNWMSSSNAAERAVIPGPEVLEPELAPVKYAAKDDRCIATVLDLILALVQFCLVQWVLCLCLPVRLSRVGLLGALGSLVLTDTLLVGRFGWTLAMRCVEHRVESLSGSPASYKQAFIRSISFYGLVILATASGLLTGGGELTVWLYGGAVLYLFVNLKIFASTPPSHRGLPDRLAGTEVVALSPRR